MIKLGPQPNYGTELHPRLPRILPQCRSLTGADFGFCYILPISNAGVVPLINLDQAKINVPQGEKPNFCSIFGQNFMFSNFYPNFAKNQTQVLVSHLADVDFVPLGR